MTKRRPRAGPRYSIVPGDFVDDREAQLSHYRVLLHLGRWTDKNGWFRRHRRQAEHAADLGIGRQCFNRALGDLIDWGYVERKTEHGRSYYRVLMDRGEPESSEDDQVSPPDDTQRGVGVSHASDNELSSACDMAPSGVSHADDISVASEATPYSDLSLRPQISPPSPQRKRRGARASVSAQILSEGGPYRHVVQHLVGPLYDSKMRPRGIENAPAFLRSLRDGLGSEGFTAEDLQRAYNALDKSRTVMPGLPVCLTACRQAKAERRRAAVPDQARPQGALCRRDPSVTARSRELHGLLRSRLGDDVFDAWFSDLECESLGAGALVLSVSMPFRRTWIGSHYQDHLHACCETIFPGLHRVEIAVRAPTREAAA